MSDEVGHVTRFSARPPEESDLSVWALFGGRALARAPEESPGRRRSGPRGWSPKDLGTSLRGRIVWDEVEARRAETEEQYNSEHVMIPLFSSSRNVLTCDRREHVRTFLLVLNILCVKIVWTETPRPEGPMELRFIQSHTHRMRIFFICTALDERSESRAVHVMNILHVEECYMLEVEARSAEDRKLVTF